MSWWITIWSFSFWNFHGLTASTILSCNCLLGFCAGDHQLPPCPQPLFHQHSKSVKPEKGSWWKWGLLIKYFLERHLHGKDYYNMQVSSHASDFMPASLLLCSCASWVTGFSPNFPDVSCFRGWQAARYYYWAHRSVGTIHLPPTKSLQEIHFLLLWGLFVHQFWRSVCFGWSNQRRID